MHQVWSPEDSTALRQLAAEYPHEIGQSALLAEWTEREGLR